MTCATRRLPSWLSPRLQIRPSWPSQGTCHDRCWNIILTSAWPRSVVPWTRLPHHFLEPDHLEPHQPLPGMCTKMITKMGFTKLHQSVSCCNDWWTWGGSNSRPHGCKPCALPTELQARSKIIIPQLRARCEGTDSVGSPGRGLVGLGRVELPTFPIYRDAPANCSIQA